MANAAKQRALPSATHESNAMDSAPSAPKIDDEFKALCRTLDADEKAQLRASIDADGIRDALVVWQQENVLLDGHNRLEIATELGRLDDLQYVSLPFADRAAAIAWIKQNQLGRRNLDPAEKNELRQAYELGKEYQAEKRQGERSDLTCAQVEQKLDADLPGQPDADLTCAQPEQKSAAKPARRQSAAKRVARRRRVSTATVRRSSFFSSCVDFLKKKYGIDVTADGIGLTKPQVTTFFSLPESIQEAALAGVHPADANAVHNAVDRAVKASKPKNDDQLASIPAMWVTPPQAEHINRAWRVIRERYGLQTNAEAQAKMAELFLQGNKDQDANVST